MLAEMLIEMDDYYWSMAARHRLLLIDEGCTGFCTFFLLSSEADLPRFWQKPAWSLLEDDPQGTIVYIDWLQAKEFTRELLMRIEQELVKRFPQVTKAIWYRMPKDRQLPDVRYTYRRRLDAADLHRSDC